MEWFWNESPPLASEYWWYTWTGPGYYFIQIMWGGSIIYSSSSVTDFTSYTSGGFVYYRGEAVVGGDVGDYYVGKDPTVIGIGAGAVTIAGVTQSILHNAVIVSGLGEFAIAGQTASVLWNHVLDASQTWYYSATSPAYYLQQKVVGTNIEYSIVWDDVEIESGSYSYLVPRYNYQVSPYTYYLGSSMGGDWLYSIRRDNGIMGSAQSLLWGHTVVPDIGAIVISGKDAYPSRFNTHLDVDAGAIVIDGKAASLSYVSKPIYIDMTITTWSMKKVSDSAYTLQQRSDVVRTNVGI